MTTPPGLIVTGAGGCLGGLIAAQARAGGSPLIRVGRERLDITRDGIDSSLPHDGTAAGLAPLLGDARDMVLVHCAARNSPADALADAEALIDGNLRFGFSVLEAARAAGCARMVNFGSFWQFDPQGAPSAVNSYAAMKTAFQVLIDYVCAAHGMAAVTLFLSDTYGEQDPRPKLVNLLCATARSGVPLPMSEGTQQVAPVHLDDVLAAVPVAIDLVSQDAARGGHARHFVIGNEVVTIRALVALFEQATGKALPILWGARPRLARIPEVPFLGGARLPGWQPRVALADGLRRAMTPPRLTPPV